MQDKYNLVYNIKTVGLLGGHSGMEIHKERGNANKIVSRVLAFAKDECDLKLALIEGGSKANAIPKYGLAKVVIKKEDEEAFLRSTNAIGDMIQRELSSSDSDFELVVEKSDEKVEKVFSEDSFNRVIAALTLIPTGVQSMSMNIEGLVESSNNLAIVQNEEDSVIITSALRSSRDSLKSSITKQIKTVSDIAGGIWKGYGVYPSWEFKEESNLREIFKKVYKEQFGKELAVSAIHAGLECGIFDEKFEGEMDMISFGPNMQDVHTANEKVSISSVERTYQLLLSVLKEIK